MAKHKWSLRDLYRAMEESPENPVSQAQERLEAAIRKAYAMPQRSENLAFLLNLNQEVANREEAGDPVQGPGLPAEFAEHRDLYSDDCVSMQDRKGGGVA